MPMISYNTSGPPTETGVYACRVPMDGVLLDDLFLLWSEGAWSYLCSDQRYRGQMLGWIGPLQRRMTPPVE